MTSVDLMTTVTLSPFLRASSSALRRVITLSTWLLPILTTTWAMMSPNVTSTTFPSSWFRADRGMTSGCHECGAAVPFVRRLRREREIRLRLDGPLQHSGHLRHVSPNSRETAAKKLQQAMFTGRKNGFGSSLVAKPGKRRRKTERSEERRVGKEC